MVTTDLCSSGVRLRVTIALQVLLTTPRAILVTPWNSTDCVRYGKLRWLVSLTRKSKRILIMLTALMMPFLVLI